MRSSIGGSTNARFGSVLHTYSLLGDALKYLDLCLALLANTNQQAPLFLSTRYCRCCLRTTVKGIFGHLFLQMITLSCNTFSVLFGFVISFLLAFVTKLMTLCDWKARVCFQFGFKTARFALSSFSSSPPCCFRTA